MSKNKNFELIVINCKKNNNLFDLKFLKNYFKELYYVFKEFMNINRFFKFYKIFENKFDKGKLNNL